MSRLESNRWEFYFFALNVAEHGIRSHTPNISDSHDGTLPVNLSAATHFVCMRLRVYASSLTYHMQFIAIFIRFSLIFAHSKIINGANDDYGDYDTWILYDRIKNFIRTLLHLMLRLIVCANLYTVPPDRSCSNQHTTCCFCVFDNIVLYKYWSNQKCSSVCFCRTARSVSLISFVN